MLLFNDEQKMVKTVKINKNKQHIKVRANLAGFWVGKQ